MRHPDRHPPRDDSVSLAWVTPGTVNALFMDSVLKLYMADLQRPMGTQRLARDGSGYTYLVSGPRIASARNALVRNFLEIRGSAWMLMVDTDMVFEPIVLDRLLAAADPITRPIVGALCFGGGKGRLFPTMYRLCDPAENDGNVVQYVSEWNSGDVVQVDATGAACILIHRSVLEAMGGRYPEPAPWFSETIYKGREFGEDWSFCLRAQQMGYPIFVHTGASIGHEKPVVLDEATWRRMEFNLTAEGLPEFAEVK